MLTTLPLLAFGLVSRWRQASVAGWALNAACWRRYPDLSGYRIAFAPSTALLFSGTAIIGCGIALGNVLLPGLIKRDFSQHVARMTGAYSITMGGAAALGSAMVVPLALAGFGWHGAS
jgi:CP family cyanate transporter-like MFS transporter